MSLSASAPGKLILMGEHAVVYGEPGLVIPLPSLRARVRLTAATSPRLEAPDLNLITELSTGIQVLADASHLHPLEQTLLKAQHYLHTRYGVPRDLPTLCFHVSSDIPVKRGMGSGTAISCACLRALAAYYRIPRLLADEVEAFAQEMDTLYHGRPSGIDAAVIAHERPLRFQRPKTGPPVVRFLDLPPLALLIADTGPAKPTVEVVQQVAESYGRDPRIAEVISHIGQWVLQAEDAWRSQRLDKLGQLLFANHEALQKLAVSTPTLDKLVSQARQLGIPGAKLSGAGQGGVCFALLTPGREQEQTRALRQQWSPHCLGLYASA